MKDKKGLIFNCIFAGLPLLVLIFLACPYVAVSGYYYLSLLTHPEMDPIGLLMIISILFVLLIALALLGMSVVTILTSVGVIKNEKIDKIFSLVQIILSAVLVAFAIISYMIIVTTMPIPFQYEIGALLNVLTAVAILVIAILKKVLVKKA